MPAKVPLRKQLRGAYFFLAAAFFLAFFAGAFFTAFLAAFFLATVASP
jgi:hypothetical protein